MNTGKVANKERSKRFNACLSKILQTLISVSEGDLSGLRGVYFARKPMKALLVHVI